jgi:hypothetical protein
MRSLTIALLVGAVVVLTIQYPAPPAPPDQGWKLTHWRTQHYYEPSYEDTWRKLPDQHYPDASSCSADARAKYPREVKNGDIFCIHAGTFDWIKVDSAEESGDPYRLAPGN